MMAVPQQIRLVRLAMVLVIGALTVFLYASYYTSPMLTMPTRMRLVAGSSATDYDAAVANDPTNGGDAMMLLDATQQQQQSQPQQPPHQDDTRSLVVQSDSDLNGSYAQQFSGVSVPSLSTYTNTSNAASKVSSNITTTIGGASLAVNNNNNNPSKQSTVAAAQAAVAVAESSKKASSPAATAAAAPTSIDTLKGVRTSTLYESGHSDISVDLCPQSGEFLRLLILITSAPSHYDARLAIRQTWGSFATRRDVSIGFMLGSTLSAALDDKLAAENFMYGDLIRGHFLDSYNNLTLKTISSLEWVDRYCPKVTFVLKTDDDMFINVPRLLAFTDKHTSDTRVIYGRLAKKWKPIRSKKSKYYVSPQQYFPPVFPPFTTGPAYLMTVDVVHDLYEKALNQTYLKLEDVFTTGIVAQLVNVKRVQVNEFMNRRIPFNSCNLRRVISVHMVKSNEQFDLWKKLLDTSTKCK